MEEHLHTHVRRDLLEALILARSASLVVGSSACTHTYREAALAKIFDCLAFAVPLVVQSFDPDDDCTPLCEMTSLQAKAGIPPSLRLTR